MFNFIPKNNDELYVEVIYKPPHIYTETLVATNTGYVRFLSENLDQEMKNKCVLFCDGFIRNIEREKQDINGLMLIRLNIADVISVFN